MFINQQTCNGFDLRAWVFDLADEAADVDEASYYDLVCLMCGQ